MDGISNGRSFFNTTTKVMLGVSVLMFLLFCAQIFENNMSGYIQVQQGATSGKITVKTSPGVYLQLFDTITSYKSSKHSIDRIDNNGNYCKENCRWSTKSEQARNCRNTVLVDWNGLKFKLVDLLEIYNINLSAMRSRLKCKWGIERALLTPIKGLPPLELDNSFNIINLL